MIFKLVVIASIIGIIILLSQNAYFQSSKCYEGNATIKPIFSPYSSEEVFNLIKDAKHEIKVEVYEFSNKALADALIIARENGVSVQVILDSSVYNNNGIFNYLLNNGVNVNWAPKKFRLTHSKFMIIDDSIILVGSMNWSESSMKNNREASVVIYSKEVSSEFEKVFDSDFNA